jgi:hypothetical protein
VLELQLNLRTDAFVLLPQLSLLQVKILFHRVEEFLVAHFLLLFLHFYTADILFEFTFSDAVLIFVVLERYLRLLLELGKLVKVVEDQVL